MSQRLQEFQTPPAKYRGTPFWAWNCKMTTEKVDLILESLKEMGMGGAYFHCRTGMDMPYLGEEFMNMMHYAHEKAGEAGMLTCLYDEDRWPSGFAGGLVTKEEKYRSRFLVFSPEKLPLQEEIEQEELKSCAQAVSSGKRMFLAAYAVRLEKGYLAEYLWLENETQAYEWSDKDGYHIWYAYLEVSGNHPWFNNQAYVNTLDEKAVARFIEVTYEAYYREFGADFGSRIPLIFTDEPQFTFKTQLGFAGECSRQVIPYTDDFEESYERQYGDGFLCHLPEIFWELPEGALSVHRYRYHDHVCQRFTDAYVKQIGDWCKKHHIALTGHMMREPFLDGQTMALGEAMRAYRSFDIPGIDMLCDRRELTTAKQAQSAVHQFGCKGMTSEIYGVTNWDFDFRGHKLAGDWQAALGVTNRVHHLTWTTMKGEAKRDYPAPIGYQSPWYKDYPYIENYFARLNSILTRGKAIVNVGVIHPIESYWLYWGTREQTEGIRREQEENFGNLVKWLLYGLIDFDFIAESLLAEEPLNKDNNSGFSMGEMNYDVILVPNLVTIRKSTLERLSDFVNRGGKVIFAGNIPQYVDAVLEQTAIELAGRCECVNFSRYEILKELEEIRFLDIRNHEGVRTDNILYQLREESDCLWLFSAHSDKSENPDLAREERLHFSVKGRFRVEQWMAQSGEILPVIQCWEHDRTGWETVSYEQDSFLYRLVPVKADAEDNFRATRTDICKWKEIPLPNAAKVLLEERNVLLLDYAQYRFDEGMWQPGEEILRIDNIFRKELGLPLRTEAFAQPWVNPQISVSNHTLKLRFHIESDLPEDDMDSIAWLALETPEVCTIFLNEKEVENIIEGWYVDRDIKTVFLGKLRHGQNLLEIHIPFSEKTHVEAMYLLGTFGVDLNGRTARVEKRRTELGFGDICTQGLPFYGGNFSYQMNIDITEPGTYLLAFKKFRCSAMRVAVDGVQKGIVAVSPYQIELGHIESGVHELTITVLGNRVNTFGPVHNCNQTEIWIGPDAWRSKGMAWSYEYQLKPTGLLVSPVLRLEKNNYDSVYR